MTEAKPSRRPNNLTCLICGAPCRCSYFGATCCESCKVFFRRAVLFHTRYNCTYSNNCQITQKTRRSCSACRLTKCYDVGMLAKWVINSPRVGTVNRKRKRRDSPNQIQAPQPSTFQQFPIICPQQHRCGLRITDEETKIVDALLHTTRQTIQDIPFPDEVFVEEPTFTHIINVLSIVVKRMIAFTKTFVDFRSLVIPDQVIVLKAVSLEIMLTRKATTILYKVSEKHGLVWMVENGKFLFSKSNLANAYDTTLYECYMRYISQLMALGVDDKALVILTCVCLFSPDREDLSSEGKVVLERQQMYYVSLLERYLHTHYDCDRARKIFPKMLMSQWTVRETSHHYSKAAMKCSNGEIEPLMKEFFNLE